MSRRLVPSLGRLVAALAALVMISTGLAACELTPSAEASECSEFPRTGDVERTVVIAIDISQSAVDEWPALVEQAVDLSHATVGGENPPASIQVFAQDNSVMTHAVHVQLVEAISFDFDTGGNAAEFADYTAACLSHLETQLDQALDDVTPSEGSDPFGAATFAGSLFAGAGTADNVLGLLGDGYAVSDDCNLYREALADPASHEATALRCAGGTIPPLPDVAIFQGGVGVRAEGSDPDSGDSERAVDLIAFYRDTVWPLTGARQPATVAPALSFADRGA